jgi:hypothetical protein
MSAVRAWRIAAVAFAAVVVLAGLAIVPVGRGMAEESAAEPESGRVESLRLESTPSSALALQPSEIPEKYLDEAGEASVKASIKAFFDYRTQGFEHRREVFAWQLLSSKIIFVIVVALVVVGIYFSWLQFRQGLRRPPGESETSTTFEASTTGIKITSPVLGVIILAISLAFFYLYLAYVYPIQEIL